MPNEPIHPSKTPLDTGFVDEEFADAYPAGIEHHYWNSARNRIVHRLLRSVMGERGGLCVEIGCGTGIVTDYLRRNGCNCIGVDIGGAPPCNRVVAPFLRLGVDAFELPEDLRDSTRFILMLDVLEHIERPDAFLSKCRDRFANLSAVLFTVPARMEVWTNYDEYYRHFKRYDHNTIRELFAPADYSLADWGYFFHALYPPARLLTLLKRDRQTRLSAPAFALPHRLLALAFSIEQMIVPKRMPGTSIYGILKVIR